MEHEWSMALILHIIVWHCVDLEMPLEDGEIVS